MLGGARLAVLLSALAPVLLAAAAAAAPPAGEVIYRQGVLPSGRPLRGHREAGGGIAGAGAACVTCHRRSGLGSWEGQTVIPPIIGRYLFRPGARNVEDPGFPHVQGYVPHRDAYTDATLARAIRRGVDQSGRKLSDLMPRYDLDDGAMSALIHYLKSLTARDEPGVEPETLHFATVVTPDADPAARQGMLDVLRQFFADKNAGYRGNSPPLRSSRGVMYRVNRRWQLHVWELTGPPQSWDRQLRASLAATPVFAVISGIGGRTWAPVHRFCQREAVPCLLPNVDLPVVAEDDFYPVYYSRGVLLEADLMARRAADPAGGPVVRRVVQVYRAGDIGSDGARALAGALAERRIPVVGRAIPDAGGAGALAAALADLGAGDVLALWLRPPDLAALPPTVGASLVLASGLMGGMENAPFPAAWRPLIRLTYPLDLPELRRVHMDFPLGWFRVRHIPVVAERVQTDTYLACVILSETIGHMLDSFVRDYLVERVEVLLSHRLVNAHYPRLGLAPGQRFASKGGYLARFADPAGQRLLADGDWAVP
jgi:hypothetical protein